MATDRSQNPRRSLGPLLVTLLAAAGAATGLESLELRRQRLLQLSPAEKDELRNRQEQFARWPVAEQQRLRRLHAQLLTDPNRDELQRVMERYHEWLKTIPSTQRAELLTLPLESRIEEIKRIMRVQEVQRFGPLANQKLKDADMQVFTEWLDQFLVRHEAEILSALPGFLRDRFDHIEDDTRRRILIYGAYRRSVPNPLQPGPEDNKDLLSRLSPEAQLALQEQKTQRDRNDLVQHWIRAIIFAKMMTPISQEELQKFFNEKLNTQQRDYLESLPLDRMRGELTRLYLKEKFEQFEPRGSYRGKGFPDSRSRRDGPPRGFGGPSAGGPPPNSPPPNSPPPNGGRPGPGREPSEVDPPPGPAEAESPRAGDKPPEPRPGAADRRGNETGEAGTSDRPGAPPTAPEARPEGAPPDPGAGAERSPELGSTPC